MDFAFSFWHFDNSLEYIGAMHIRFRDNTKLGEIVNVMVDPHSKKN